jgi:thioester reductase-like protein
MIPSSFIVMDAFPLTPNGKVDRKALPAVDELVSFQERPYLAPQGDLEQLLAGVWREVLGAERVGRHDNFFELGGDSIKGILLISRMQERLGKQIDVGALLQAPNVAEMASYLAAGHSIEFDPHSLETETVLDPEIYPEAIASRPLSETRSIFLTGATGFLGAFLLQSILRGTAADVFCLVRSRDAGEGAGKIKNALESYSLWDESFRSRIIPVTGDLSQPLLGLSPEEFRLLAGKVDLIYHNGALVNFVYPYALLKPVNVLGTQEVLRLASLIRAKPVHYISTISVFSSIGEQTVIREEDEPAPPISSSELPLGYAQSKWVAEKLVAEARSRGLPVSVYRPGRITGHSLTGVSSPDDFACRFIRGCVQLGAMPDWDGEVNIIPVDYVSQAIVHLSMERESMGKVFHLMNPRSIRWDEIVGWFRSYGFSIRQATYREWREGIERSPDNALYPLLATFPHDEDEDDRTVPEVSSQKRVDFDCRNTLAGLKDSPVICPPADFALIDAYLSYLVRRGVLDAPSSIESGNDSIVTPGVAA